MNKTNNFVINSLGSAAVNWIMTAEVVGILLLRSRPPKLSVSIATYQLAHSGYDTNYKWHSKNTRTRRTRLTTSAIALIGRAVVNWIMMDNFVRIVIWVLVLWVIVFLNCQSPLPPINWHVPDIIFV